MNYSSPLSQPGVRNRDNLRWEQWSGYRYIILVLLWLATFLNYLDRATLAVVKDDVQQQIGASETQMGFLLSAFAWSITLVIVLFGVLLQRYGARGMGTISLSGFSLMTGLTATVSSFPGLAFFRVGLGIFEAPTFPLNSNLVRNWFPRSQRARAVSFYMTGSFFGLAFAVPLLGWILSLFGFWQSVFLAAGLLGLMISTLWWALVRSTPEQCRWVRPRELQIIRGEPEAPPVIAPSRPNAADWCSVLFGRRHIGTYLGAFGTSTVVFFFITWFPSYLKTQLGFDFTDGGGFGAALPYMAGMLGMLLSGVISDRLVRRGMSPGQSRKVTVTVGLFGAAIVAVVPLLGPENTPLIMTVLCLSFFFAGMANTAWLLATEIAQPRLLGLTTGVYGFWANLFGAITPIVVGVILDASGGSYSLVFGYIAAAAIIGAASYLLLIDRVEPSADTCSRTGTPPRGSRG